MKTRRVLCAIAWMFLAMPVLAEDAPAAAAVTDENPFRTAKVGDWIRYRQNARIGTEPQVMEFKQTIVKKTDDEATVEMEMTIDGQPAKQPVRAINLKEKYVPSTAQQDTGEAKQIGSGEETVAVGGNFYKTSWTEVEYAYKEGGVTMKTKVKTWTSKDVPLGGLVKSHTETPQSTVEMELVDFGSGK